MDPLQKPAHCNIFGVGCWAGQVQWLTRTLYSLKAWFFLLRDCDIFADTDNKKLGYLRMISVVFECVWNKT
jgi:hypothetical protein